MICPKCGAVLDEDSKFCVTCGTNIEDADNGGISRRINSVYSSNDTQQLSGINTTSVPENKNKRVIGNIIRIVVSLTLIIIGVIRIVSAGTSISSTSFGGDFYTYTYKGIVAISEILSSVEVTLGWVVIAIGASIGVKVFRD